MPGNVTSRNSFGTNYLIKGAGAKLVQQWQDIVSEFPPELAARILPPEPAKKGKARDEELTRVPADLSDGERAVLKLVPADESVHIDALAESSGLAVQELVGVLLNLELRDLITQLPGKCFARKL